MPLQRSYRAQRSHSRANIAIRPPENRISMGAVELRRALGRHCRIVRRSPIPRQYNFVINWGNSNDILFRRPDTYVFNQPNSVADSVNKIRAFQLMGEGGVRVPEFRTSPPSEVNEESSIWLARHNVHGSGGTGITVVRGGERFPVAPLYVKYVRKTAEYRVHVAFGCAFFCQFKLRRREEEQTKDQKLIRNHDNGWVFAPRDIEELPDGVSEQAKAAIAALGLHFGAVDVVMGKKDELPYVLEVNTAPGISSPSLKEAYKTVFSNVTGYIL